MAKTKQKRKDTTAQKSADVVAPLTYFVGGDGRITQLTAKSMSAGSFPLGGVSRISAVPDSEWGYAFAYAANEWAFRCITILKQKIGEILRQAKLHRKADGAIADKHPYYEALNRSFLYYRKDVYERMIESLMIFGESYTEKVWSYGDQPVPFALRWLNPLAVEPVIMHGIIERFDYMGDERTIHFRPNELMYIPLDNPLDDYRGLSPMRTALAAINLDMNIQKSNNARATNGMQPGLIITVKDANTVQDADWQAFKENLQKDMKGAKNAYRTLALRTPVDITTVELPKPDEQIELTANQKERVASVFGIPVSLLTFGDMKYQLSPEQRKSLYEETLIPRAEQITRWINADALPFFDARGEFELKLDRTLLTPLIEDQQAKTNILNAQLLNSAMTVNQYREALNQKPTPDGDVYFVPTNVRIVAAGNLSDVVEQPAPEPAQLPAGTPVQQEDVFTVERDPIESAITTARSAGRIVEPKHATAQDELRAWERAAKQSGVNKALRFQPFRIPEKVQYYLQENLYAGIEKDALKSVFETAGSLLAIKAIAATRLDFEGEFDTLLNAARSGDIDRRNFGNRLRTMLRIYARKAYVDGLVDGGVEDGELDSDDESDLSTYVASQSEFVTSIGNTLYKEDGVTDAQADVKAAMWFNKSIEPAYQKGLLSADKNSLYEWVYGDTEHCDTCQTMNGQKHRLKDYARRGILPRADILDCNGFNCECNLVKTTGKVRGSWA